MASNWPDGKEPAGIVKSKIDIIYTNIHSASNFRTFRTGSNGTVEEVLLRVAKHVEKECYKIVSISASAGSFVVVLSTELSRKELVLREFPLPGWEKSDWAD